MSFFLNIFLLFFFFNFFSPLKKKFQKDHPNILKFIDYAESVNNIYMFMEYCQEGSLERKLRKSNYQIDIGIALSIFR